LASLTNLTTLYLNDNQISDVSPLVENSGLGEGDTVWLANNNLDLSEGSEDLENIRQLEARGVSVSY
jgi:Leucine-rich repeat (LRR) protein